MIDTIEMRWFFPLPPFEREKLFPDNHKPETRTDWYAIPSDDKCGVKTRQGKLETKLLLKEPVEKRFGDIAGYLENWGKWSVEFTENDEPAPEILKNAGWMEVQKTRFLVTFSVEDGIPNEIKPGIFAENGCQLEWTEINANGHKAVSIGLEAWSQTGKSERNLAAVAEKYLKHKFSPTPFTLGFSYSYPFWLNSL